MSEPARSVDHRPDATLYTLRSTRGAVQLIIWAKPEPFAGPIGIHSPTPLYGTDRPGPCDVLPDGQGYCDQAFRAGADVYELTRGVSAETAEGLIFAELERWYAARIDPREINRI